MLHFNRRPGDGTGFAVVDLETTGLYPQTDRVVEVAVVHVSVDGDITGEFSTLINPGRDVGRTQLHGIRAADVATAPSFAAAAAAVWQLLAGRVLVAHNVLFDARFLETEFARCGMCMPSPPVMCTMQLASYYLPGLPSRKLPACCEAAGVKLAQHHSALADAQAAAGLLACYRSAHQQLPGSWRQALAQASQIAWPAVRPQAEFRPITRSQAAYRRAQQRPPLAGLVDRLPRGADGNLDAYLAVLDSVLEDRIITGGEAARLSGLAGDVGLTRDAAARAHRDYLNHVAVAAWRDGRVTDAEHADLLEVARLLDVAAADALAILNSAKDSPRLPPLAADRVLQPGDRVVLTGDMSMSRAEIEALATAAGLRVTGAVSGKTALLVSADPYSQSGKASRARALGVRMVTEQVFLHMLGERG